MKSVLQSVVLLVGFVMVHVQGEWLIGPNNMTYQKSNNQHLRGVNTGPHMRVSEVIRNRKRRDVAYTDEEKESALYWHNYYRNLAGASDMLYMVSPLLS